MFQDTLSPLLHRNIRQEHLLGWSCQIPPYKAGNEAQLFPSPFVYGMVGASAQMAFPEHELFATSGTALLLALGQRTPPPAQATAPHSAHHHTRSALPTSGPHTLKRYGGFPHKPQFTSCFSSPKQCFYSQTCLLRPSHLCSCTRTPQYCPEQNTDTYRFLLPFLGIQHFSHHIPPSCNTDSSGVGLPLPWPPVNLCCHLSGVSPLWFSPHIPH